jgi:hypothetical protein
MSNWKYVTRTVQEFVNEAQRDNWNVDPEWQRLDTNLNLNAKGSKPSKAQSIIASMFNGQDIGEIKLCDYEGVKSSIDGGNRKRAILNFYNNKFALPKGSKYAGLKYKDLSEDAKELFLSYVIRFIEYGEITTQEIGETFRNTNNTTPVNKQEMRNSEGQNPVAVLVRRTTRKIDEVGNIPHILFDWRINAKGDAEYTYLTFNNKGLHLDEQTARLLCRVLQGEKSIAVSDDDLDKMYADYEAFLTDEENLKKAKKKLYEVLDFIVNIADTARKYKNGRGLAHKQYEMLVRLYFYLKEHHKSFKVTDASEFWVAFTTAMDSVLSCDDITFKERSGKTRVVAEAFGQYLKSDLNDQWKYDKSLELFLNEFNLDNCGLKLLDPKRCFSRDEIESALIKQGYKDFIDGKKLTMKDAVGAHVIAHSNGGKTETDNLVVVSKAHNTAMGTMPVDVYKASLGY